MSKTKYPKLNDKEWLYQEYYIKKLSTTKIAHIVNCNDATVWRALKKSDITIRTKREAAIEYFKLNDKEWLEEQYLVKKLHPRQIAEIVGCASPTVRAVLNHFGIKSRTASEAKKGKLHPLWGKQGPMYNKHHTEETKAKLREARKHRILPTHHTKPEMIFEEICKKYNLPFRYIGDGSFWIGEKPSINPDFMHLTRKVVVEIFSWHHNELQRHCKVPYPQTYEGRKKILKKRGYKMIVFWQDDLDREDAEARVLSVLNREKVY